MPAVLPGRNYRPWNISRDTVITNDKTGAGIGLRVNEQEMVNGVSDYASLMGGGLTAITNRQIIIPANAQSVIVGTLTITDPGSITCDGEFAII